MEKVREFQKTIYFCFIDHAKAFDCVDDNKLWKILQEIRISDRLTCLLINLYAGQEATVRTRHGTGKLHSTQGPQSEIAGRGCVYGSGVQLLLGWRMGACSFVGSLDTGESETYKPEFKV